MTLNAEYRKLNFREQLFLTEYISVVFISILYLYILLQFVPISTNSFVYLQENTNKGNYG